ncbi:Hydroxypyruvate reductase [BD1-7 clade bacterium]|uniref:D-3-phosphoglycerate dehydrogenase n=1 Tax=BD1-7 clade bacterium TaxID=2029982 RepID=A0A5S9QR65_9GAMM|nr:Hydroxypyruvate reductase [BD1-7 clade bacterium]CAA0122550.1 Hydroxypyruvate reductase [BD1-7 clade bacterium]
MLKVRTYNAISVKGLERFSLDSYEVASEINTPDAFMLRSHVLSEDDLPASLRAIGRAGAGTNNVPVAACTARGIPVFNAPGANANAVKELVLTGMLLSCRGIVNGIAYANSLSDMTDSKEMAKKLEAEKKRFKGEEIKGKTLGVVGLGAIGSLVAEMALQLGMNVVGYDPALSVEAAWRLPSDVQRMDNLSSLLGKSDFVSLHLPVLEATRNLINRDTLASAKKGLRILNFAREQIVDTASVVEALDAGKIDRYITDFPTPELINRDDVIPMPHIGASTGEAEDNCAIMVADQLQSFLENGNIKNSVNFPATQLDRTPDTVRLAIANNNVPKILSSILALLADSEINVVDMINKSRADIAYSLIDVDTKPEDSVLEAITTLDGVINLNVI